MKKKRKKRARRVIPENTLKKRCRICGTPLNMYNESGQCLRHPIFPSLDDEGP